MTERRDDTGGSPAQYDHRALTREQVDAFPGLVVLQFGTNWCGICRKAEPMIERACAARSDVTRIKVEDGPGRALGRSFAVKLWPTLVFLKEGREITRRVRPESEGDVASALARLQ